MIGISCRNGVLHPASRSQRKALGWAGRPSKGSAIMIGRGRSSLFSMESVLESETAASASAVVDEGRLSPEILPSKRDTVR